MLPPLQILPKPMAAADDRFQRFSLISWWDQSRLSAAKVLVAGAGALGNEIVKNLALLGVGQVLIADMDRIENSNLSRSVLFRRSDNGRHKAVVAAESARDIYPDIKVHPFVGNIVHDLGLGVFRWADIVIAGLDNREARLAINRNCWKVNRPWIDGAIEAVQGTVRLFAPDGPCYECTMSDLDWKLLASRRSCNLLSRAEMENGRTPTTPTISAIIAGVQCQEALKHLHGLDTIRGRGWVFSGLSADSYQFEFQRMPNCYSHDTLGSILPLEASVDSITPRQLLMTARQALGPDAQLEFSRDILSRLTCPNCHRSEKIYASLGKVPASAAFCPHCPDTRREIETFYKITGHEEILDLPLSQLGIPPFDIVIARAPDGRSIGIELSGDAPAVLGALYQGEGLEWT